MRAQSAPIPPASAPALHVIPASQLSEPLLQALDLRTRQDPLLAHQEGHFKVEVMRALLSLGYSLQEGAPRADMAHFASPTPGAPDMPSWKSGPRLVRVEDGSSDIAALQGSGYRQFELKTRCDHGSKSGAAVAEIAADLERVARSSEFTFFGVFDGGIYRSFSGDKIERRGRKASMPALTAVFPPADKLVAGQVHRCGFPFQGTPLTALLIRQDVPGNGLRVLVTVDRED